MRRRPSSDHQEAVARRLALLSAELAAVREPAADPRVGLRPGPAPEGQPHWTAEHTRIATRPRMPSYAASAQATALEPPAESHGEPPVEPQVPPHVQSHAEAPALPVPGRHAARRSRAAVSELLPETLRGRAWLGPSQVAVLAVLLMLGLVVTCWWVLRGRPQEVAAPVASASASSLATLSAGATTAAAPEVVAGVSPVAASASGGGGGAGTVTVDVEGKVGHPGIVVLDAGARVVDALERAGGARHGADLTGLNLARVLVDGEQVLVGVPGAPPPAAATGASAPAAGVPGGPLVNLNTATESELEALPEVGPVTAQSILTWRDQHGGFSSVDELLEVDGIGDATLSKLAPLVTV